MGRLAHTAVKRVPEMIGELYENNTFDIIKCETKIPVVSEVV